MPIENIETLREQISLLTTKNNELEQELNNLKEKNIEIEQKITKINFEDEIQEKILTSYRKQFQTIFFDHELKSKGNLKYFQDMGVEIIKFIANICKKYNLEYWLDYGTLIGAMRHEGYIPWDDDIDLGMMRKDFNKFMKVFDDEIKRFDLENHITWNIDKIISQEYVQSFIKIYYFDSNWHSLGGLDIFSYDFLIEKKDNIEELYYEEEYSFHKKIMDGVSREEAEKDYFDKLGLKYDFGKYIIPGVDGDFGNGPGELKLKYHCYEDIFPLKENKFCENYFKCPNNSEKYLDTLFVNYYFLPRIVYNHNVIERMNKIPILENEYIKEIRKLTIVNMNFFK